ncbi:zinc finger, CCHC-type containing protein, partial [Tanacetum coccineum]
MASSITRFDIEKFDGKNNFGLWQIKMRALMVQQGCDAALETLPADMETSEKATLMKKAYNTLILCVGDRVLRDVTKLTSTKLGDHINEFNKLILDLANIDIEIEDEDQALMLLTSLPSSYENFEGLLKERLSKEEVQGRRFGRRVSVIKIPDSSETRVTPTLVKAQVEVENDEHDCIGVRRYRMRSVFGNEVNLTGSSHSTMHGQQGGFRFEVPALDEDVEYQLCLSVTPKNVSEEEVVHVLYESRYETGDHIDEFNKLILDLANIDIEIEDKDQALMLLTLLPSSYENFMETLLYGRESLTMEDVLATLNSREGRSDHSGKAHSGESLRFKSRCGTSKLKCFICHLEGHLKRDCPMKKSSGLVKKGKHDQDSDSSDDEGSTYFGEALMVVRNDEMTELLGDNRTCTIKGTGKVKIQLHDGSSFILEDNQDDQRLSGYDDWDQKKELCLEAKVMTFGVQNHGGSKQVRLKQLGSKQVGFKQLGHKQVGFKQLGPGVETGIQGVHVDKRVWFEVQLQGAQGNRKAEVFQVSNDDAAVAQRRLEDKQLEEKTNTDCLVKEQEKVHLGIKVGANITVIGVPGQEGAESNVVGKKKVKESMEANLGKLLKYNAWST